MSAADPTSSPAGGAPRDTRLPSILGRAFCTFVEGRPANVVYSQREDAEKPRLRTMRRTLYGSLTGKCGTAVPEGRPRDTIGALGSESGGR